MLKFKVNKHIFQGRCYKFLCNFF